MQGTRYNTVTEADEAEASDSDDEEDDDEDDDERTAESPLAPRATRRSTSDAGSSPAPSLKTALVKGRHRLRKAA